MLKLAGIYRLIRGKNHAVFQMVHDDVETLSKLQSYNSRILGGKPQSDLLDLLDLLDLEEKNTKDKKNKEPEHWRKPFGLGEFVVKIPKKYLEVVRTWRNGLELIIWVKPTQYKFEKDKWKYNGWNITLKKFINTSIIR